MFGTFPFGTPYFAQGTGQGAAAALAASATLAVGTSAAILSGVAAPLAASAQVSIAVSAADLTKPAAQLQAAAALSIAAGADLTKPAAALAASATLSITTSAGFTKVPAALAATARVSISTSAALHQPAAVVLTAVARLSVSTTATLTQVLAPPDRACAHPLPIDEDEPVLVGCSFGAFPIDPTRVGRRGAGYRARTPLAPPPAPAPFIAPAARVCHQGLPIDPGYTPTPWGALDPHAHATDCGERRTP